MQKGIFAFALFSFSLTLFPATTFAQVPEPPVITPPTLGTSAFGVATTVSVTASGGVLPYIWSASGLPNGVFIDSDTGVLSGTSTISTNIPSSATTNYTVTLSLQDAVGQTTSTTTLWSLTSSFAATRTPSGSVASGTPAISVHGIMGYDFCPEADSYTLFLNGAGSGFFQSGFSHAIGDTVDDSWSPATPAGVYNPFGLQCPGNPAVNLGGFTIVSAPVISTAAALPAAVINQAYSTTLSVSSDFPATPYTWTITAGSLPTGMTLSSAGVISGTATATTSAVFFAKVTDAVGQATVAKRFTLAVLESMTPPTITAPILGTSAFGVATSVPVSILGGVAPYTWSASGLPSGVSINGSTGVIVGTSTISTVMPSSATTSYAITLQAIDSIGQTTTATTTWNLTSGFVVTRTPSLSIASGTPTIAIHGTMGYDFCPGLESYELLLSGGGSGFFNAGFSHTLGSVFNDNWSPAIPAGAYTLSLLCSGIGGATLQTFTIASIPTTTTNALLSPALVNLAYSTTLAYSAAFSAPPYTWSVTSGSLPLGMSLDSSTGVISGLSALAATSIFFVKVTDSIGQSSTAKRLTLPVQLSLISPVITPPILATSNFGTATSVPVSISGGVSPYTWSAIGLPDGVSINPDTGVIVGTSTISSNIPTSATSTYSITLDVQDSLGQIGSATTSWKVLSGFAVSRTPSASVASGTPVINVQGVMGYDFCPQASSYNVFLSGGGSGFFQTGFSHPVGSTTNDTWSPQIPAGTYSLGVECPGQAANSIGTFTIASVATITTNGLLPPATTNDAYSTTLIASAAFGAPPYTWFVSSGTIPSGFTLGSTTGTISGTGSATSSTIFFVKVQDATGQQSLAKRLTLNVLGPLIIANESASTTAPTATSVTITWTTVDHPSTSRVVFDTVSHSTLGSPPNYGYASSTVEDPTLTINHSVTINGLSTNTTYYFRSVSHGSPEVAGAETSARPAPYIQSLSPLNVWVGLKNSDDAGTRFDLKAEVYKDLTLVGSGELANVTTGGSSSFSSAHLDSIPLTLLSPAAIASSTLLTVKLSVRNACTGPTHNSGTARLWYDGPDANSNFGATIDSTSKTYYFHSLLFDTATGTLKKTIDVSAGSPCSSYKLFGIWFMLVP